jgi:hypothetical protein
MVAARLVTGQAQAKSRLRRGFRDSLPELAVGCAALLLYALFAPTLGFDLVFDDRSLLGPDGPKALGNGVLPYRPLRYSSYVVDALLGGGAAWAYHATNVALHALAAGLVVRVTRRLGGSPILGLFAGLLFVSHPLAVEAVAYVSGRRDLLATVLGTASLLLWTNPKGRSAAALALLLLAVASKESGALFLVALVLASVAGLGPPLSRAGLALAGAAAAAVTLPIAYGAVGPIAPSASACALAATTTKLATHYGLHLLVPIRLAIEYPELALASAECAGLLDVSSLAGFLLLGAAAGLLLAGIVPSRRGSGRRGERPAERQAERSSDAERDAASGLTFAWAWVGFCFLALATVVGTHEPGADRHAYPLLAAVSVASTLGVGRLLMRRERRALVFSALAASLVVATLAGASARRASIWRDERTLWTAAVADAPTSGRAHHNLAGVLLAAGELDAAALHVRRARELDYPPALLGDAAIACARGRLHRGRDLLARARLIGLPAADIAAIIPSCEKQLPRKK